MDLAYLDHVSNNGDGWLNQCSVIPKILLTGVFMAISISADTLAKQLLIFFPLFVLHLSNKVNLGKLIHLMFPPVFFSLIFALMRFSYAPEEGFVLMLKAVNAALAMILLIVSTPYPRIFSFFRLFLPGTLVDAMFFTYRTFFTFLEKVQNALKVLKLKGGLQPQNVLVYIRQLSGIIGIIFINAFASSERMYNIYALRGYEGRLYEGTEWLSFNKQDAVIVLIIIVLILMAVVY